MKVKATKSFSGTISMHIGEVRETAHSATIDELIRIGYLEEVKENAKPVPEKAETSETEVKADENKRGKPKRN